MITKNEMDRLLTLAVTHLLTYCQEIRVLDDGSDDGSYEWLCEQDGVEVLRNPGPSFFEHEGHARQNLLEWTMGARPDYVLAIDADELVGDPKVLLDGIGSSAEAVYTIPLVEAWKVDTGGISIRVDGLWGPRKVPSLFRPPESWPPRRGNDRLWRIMDKQLACGREPMAVIRAGARAPVLATNVFHFGWTRESERKARAERYFVHDGGRFHQNRHLQSILNPDDKVGLRGYPWPEGLRKLAPDLIEYAAR